MSTWHSIRGVVRDVVPGAQYEGTVYDQYIVVEAENGCSLTAFDMTPMVAEGIQVGLQREFLVVAAIVRRLAVETGSSDGFPLLAVAEVLPAPKGATLRSNGRGPWLAVLGECGPIWLPESLLTEVGIAPDPETRLSWERARLDLYGWWRTEPSATSQ